LTIHQVCGKVVDSLMQNAAREKSFDNLTIVMIAFKGLLDYLTKKGADLSEVNDNNQINQNIKISEGENSMILGQTSSANTSMHRQTKR